MTTPDDARHEDAGRWRALALLCAAQFMVMFDGAVVNVALPSIQRDLHFSSASLQWVFTAYLLAFGGLLMLGGRTADLLGRRRMFMIGAGLLGAASLFAGLSGSQGELIAARGLMGAGAAIITPAALSMILGLFEDGAERNRALGIWGGLVGLAAATGVLFGGFITEGPGWQWIFFLNVPLAAAVVAAAPALLRESWSRFPGRGLDLAGGLLVTTSLVLLVYGIVRAPDAGWGSAQTLLLLAGGLLLLAAFVVIELRAAAPLLPLGLLRIATVAGSNIVVFLANGALTATIFVMTLYMQRSLGYSAIKTGLAYLPLTIGILVFSTLAARLVTKCGVKLVLLAGTLITAAGLLVFAQASSTSSFAGTLLPGFLLIAAGMGGAMVPLSIAAFAGVDEEHFGAASGLFNTSQQIGGALGVAVLSTVAYSHIRSVSATALRHGLPVVLGTAYANAFAAAIALAGAAFLIATVAIRQREVSTWHCATPYRLRGGPLPAPAMTTVDA